MAKISSRVKNLHRKIAQSNLRLFAKLDEDSKANKTRLDLDLQKIELRNKNVRTEMQKLLNKGAAVEKLVLEVSTLLLQKDTLKGFSAVKFYGPSVSTIVIDIKYLNMVDILTSYRYNLYKELDDLDEKLKELLNEAYYDDDNNTQ